MILAGLVAIIAAPPSLARLDPGTPTTFYLNFRCNDNSTVSRVDPPASNPQRSEIVERIYNTVCRGNGGINNSKRSASPIDFPKKRTSQSNPRSPQTPGNDNPDPGGSDSPSADPSQPDGSGDAQKPADTQDYSAKPIDDSLKCSVLPPSVCDFAHNGKLDESGIWQLLLWILGILTFGVGVVATAAVGYAGFLYTTAQDSSEQTKKAIEMIRNTVIGIIAYALMYAFLQFIIPGGIFR